LTLKIGVLMGGRSAEREVSLVTGEAVYRALENNGRDCIKIDVNSDVATVINNEKIDLAFLALHGRFGEDGTIQGLLEMLGVPYTGSGVLASALTMDKVVAKKIMSFEGLPTPESFLAEKKQFSVNNQDLTEQIVDRLGLPSSFAAVLIASTRDPLCYMT
jgi:D-alanine-D-alanine ligase